MIGASGASTMAAALLVAAVIVLLLLDLALLAAVGAIRKQLEALEADLEVLEGDLRAGMGELLRRGRGKATQPARRAVSQPPVADDPPPRADT